MAKSNPAAVGKALARVFARQRRPAPTAKQFEQRIFGVEDLEYLDAEREARQRRERGR